MNFIFFLNLLLKLLCINVFSPANKNHREKLNELLHSHKTQYAVVILVIIDIIIVIAELVLDLRAVSGEQWKH